MVGPYGPGTVFQQWSPSRKLIRANVWVKSTRVGQLLGDAMGWFRFPQCSPAEWQGMEMFMGNQVAADDPRLAAVYDNFRQNLIDICGDCPARRGGGDPFDGGGEPERLPAAGLAAPIRLVGRGSDEVEVALSGRRRAGSEKTVAEAIAKYEAAAQIDDRFAELPFRRGRCLAALGR